MWMRVLERRAKLYGLDMQQGVFVPQMTAEMMAELFFDEQPRIRTASTIDVEGEELSDEREARRPWLWRLTRSSRASASTRAFRTTGRPPRM